MEGPRLRLAALASRLLDRRALRGARLAALANRLLRCRLLLGATGAGLPTSAPVARPFHRSLGLPREDPVFSGEEFLLPIGPAAQGLSARSSRFFFHPHDICRLSPMHSNFPLRRAQAYPQNLWMRLPDSTAVPNAGTSHRLTSARPVPRSRRRLPSAPVDLPWQRPPNRSG